MNNINPYNEEQFRKHFESTELYKKISKDFTHLTWDSHCNIYEIFTPRQFLGDNSKNVCSMVPFYYLEYLLETQPEKIYDLGCGWNMFKKYITNIVGVGEESVSSPGFYGDEHGRVDENYIETYQNFFESVFAINALHFVPLSQLQSTVKNFISMVAPSGRGFISLNLQRMVERSSDDFLISNFNTLRPTNQQFDHFVRQSLNDLPCRKILVFEVDVLKSLNDVMDGNIRIVFER
jgi:hypothetical protein